jgi:uncharacterized repeat protein (TIGR02543 family)
MSKKITFTTSSSSSHSGRGYFKTYNSLWVFLLLIAGFTAGCQKDDFKDEITGVCPVVVSTDPDNKDVDVVLEKLISATFNTDMDPATINKTTFKINLGSKEITGTVAPTASAKTFTFDPDVDLEPFKEYTGIITTGAKDPLHTAMISNHVWTFTTIPQLTVLAKPVGSAAGGIVEGAGKFAQASAVTVKAIPLPGYFFVNWTENDEMVAPTAIYPFAMAGNRTLVANFALIPKYTLTVSATPAAGGTARGGGIFESGTSVTATATLKGGYTFVNWTEGNLEVSKLLAFNFPLTANRILVANFKANQFTLDLSSLPEAGGITTGGGLFDSGTALTAEATARPGYTFVNWTENNVPVSANASLPILLTANRTLVANFKVTQYALALSARPAEGGTVTGAGSFDTGKSVTATAAEKPNYTFVNWTEDGVSVSPDLAYTFLLTGNRTLVANFKLATVPGKFVVNLSAEPLLGGTPTGEGSYDPSASVTVSTTVNTGFTFVNWTENGAPVSTSASFTFLIAADRNLVAHFAPVITPVNYTLNVHAVNGSVVKNPNLPSYLSGTPVELTATPNPDYTFTGWSGDASGTLNPTTVIMTSNKNVTANFTKNPALPAVGPILAPLGDAGEFVILTKAGITNVFRSAITGNIGTGPITGEAITGLSCAEVAGFIYTVDAAGPDCRVVNKDFVDTAVFDMELAFNTAQGRTTPAPVTEYGTGILNGQILAPGLYKWGTNVSITDGITLNGGANDTWIFQISQDLIVNNGAIIHLTGGAQAKNIQWVVTGKATLGTTVDFSGTILSKTLISLNTGAKVKGRLLAQTEVTLIKNTVTKP